MKSRKTKEEIAAEKEARKIEVVHNRLLRSYATKVKNNCKNFGLKSTELQLQHIKNTEVITTPKGLSKDEMISCYERGIAQFKEESQETEA